MRKSLKIARVVQLAGCALLVAGIVSCSAGGGAERSMGLYFLAGIVLVIGARIYEWLSKE